MSDIANERARGEAAADAPAADARAADLAQRLRPALGRLSRRLRDTAAGHELTPTQISVLFMVVRHGPLGLKRLAELEDLNPTMLSRVVAELERRALLTRAPDPGDRRAAVVTATAAGVALRERIQRERAETLGRELERLEPDQLAALEAALPVLDRLGEQLAEQLAERRR